MIHILSSDEPPYVGLVYEWFTGPPPVQIVLVVFDVSKCDAD